MAEVQLCAVDPTLLWQIWPIAAPYIEKAFKRNDHMMPDALLHELRAGEKILWIASDGERVYGAIVTGIFQMNTGKLCKMLDCGGEEMPQWLHLRATIEEYAKAEGCDRLLIEGRPGWQRLFPEFRLVGVILEKRI